ncbi:hypothetical protein DERP_001263 [Dermatophagoides pteronyssinus]|uniref:Uncharacterized protein n=1 Tax=Dermatophagoides pteronyssinus TaxID=6956 RepID=A0ABQ8JDZ4_DERPT|nr:hypothetical protein DERP_001263 [Dermatophagoides pteronyssinus]
MNKFLKLIILKLDTFNNLFFSLNSNHKKRTVEEKGYKPGSPSLFNESKSMINCLIGNHIS